MKCDLKDMNTTIIDKLIKAIKIQNFIRFLFSSFRIGLNNKQNEI